MKEIIILTIISGFTFLIFILTLFWGLAKKDKKLKLIALFFFFAFLSLTGWTGFKFVSKSYNKVTEIFKSRSGDEIYDALFDKRQTDCVKILSYQDQVVPKIDYAIWLHFETCPREVERILQKHKFTESKLSIGNWNGKIPYGENLEWFNPTTLGDTIMVYEYSTN
ncbi:hypothetical protein, partial [Xanthovirga aplysinae]|uniref:hypothetical protein n=1 Tax=Xanthovirga aplysinae TaxID=2529853 RepID=UPI0012BC7685